MLAETSSKPLSGAFAVLAVALLAVCALGGAVMLESEDSEGACSFSFGTAYVGQYYSNSKTQTVYNYGESAEPTGFSPSSSATQNGLTASFSQGDVSTAPKLTVSISGTPTKAGTITWRGTSTYFFPDSNEDMSETVTVSITVSNPSTPVTSISISGSSSVNKESSILLSASVSPTNATDRSVTWSVQSGSSYVSISSSGTSCTVTGKAVGTATIKCTANDGSGKYATKQITVNNPTYYYRLYYDANGGSGEPNTQTLTASDTTSNLKFTISSSEPTRAGYTFLGWSKSETATSASYKPGGTIYVDYDDVTLYAVWQENKQTYYAYLYYNANGGTGAPSTQSDSIYASSASGSKSFTIPSTKPTKSGFDFLGWSTSSSATSPSYQPGSPISVSYGASKTLYAVWKEKTYTSTLNFDANGGTGAPSSLTYTGTSTSAHAFDIPSTKPTRSGFDFLGWSENSSATSPSYQPGSSIPVPYDGSKTLYAVWKEQSAAVDRGSISDGDVIQILVDEVSTLTIPTAKNNGAYMTAVSGEDWVEYDTQRGTGIVTARPTEVGTYEFSVRLWIPGLPDSALISYTLEVVGEIVEKQYFYATLRYDANGGTGAPFAQSDSIYASSPSGSKSFTISSTEPTRSGFVFLGWSTSVSATSPSYQPGSSIPVPYDGSKTLYAVWKTAQLEITSEPATRSLKVGQSWSYTPVADADGCTVSVSGASWLSVSDGRISGTPTSAGTYRITVTMSKDGYVSATQSIDLKVYSSLGFNSAPGADGILAYVR